MHMIKSIYWLLSAYINTDLLSICLIYRLITEYMNFVLLYLVSGEFCIRKIVNNGKLTIKKFKYLKLKVDLNYIIAIK